MKNILVSFMLAATAFGSPALADTQALLENAFLCNTVIAPQSNKQSLMKAGIISGKGSDGSASYVAVKPFSILGFPVKSFTFDGADDSDANGMSVDLGADFETVRRVLVDRKIKLKKVKNAPAYEAKTSFGTLALYTDPKKATTSLICQSR